MVKMRPTGPAGYRSGAEAGRERQRAQDRRFRDSLPDYMSGASTP
jgi:hypothetical protein